VGKAKNKKTEKKITLIEKAENIPSNFKSSYLIFFIIFVALLLSFPTYKRNGIWKDDTGLWEDVVRKNPKNARGYNNLGVAYKKSRLIDQAFNEYQIAINLNSNYVDAYSNKGNIYQEKGLLEEAFREIQKL